MNPEYFLSLKKEVDTLLETIKDIKADINGVKLNQNISLKKNNEIPPGISCKIAYDKNGLIIKGMPLELSDLPEITIDMIKNLTTKLDSKIERQEFENIKLKIGNIDYNKKQEYGVPNLILKLFQDDIPELPIEKIIGLNDRLTILETSDKEKSTEEVYSINPGTFPKITYNSEGKVVSGSKLSIDDIPIDIINHIYSIESRMITFANNESIKILSLDVENRVKANKPIDAGIYTKVTVDKKGLVTSGDKLMIHDLPVINIENIPNLDASLRRKAEQSDLVNLNNTVASLTANLSINNFQNLLKDKLDKKELASINNRFDSIQELINRILQSMPSDLLLNEVNKLADTLSTLIGRISVLEQKLNIEEDFINPIEE
jgi:hypothetical protein